MADRSIAIRRTLGFEDPSWDDPTNGGRPESDPPGVARFGINSAYNTGLPPDFFSGAMAYPDALALAMATYTVDYWLSYFDTLQSQDVANVLFDLQVNPGSGAGTRIVQAACNDLGQALTVDGGYGALTDAAVRACDPADLIEAIQRNRIAYYQSRPGWANAGDRAAWTQRTYAA